MKRSFPVFLGVELYLDKAFSAMLHSWRDVGQNGEHLFVLCTHSNRYIESFIQ